MSTTVSLTLTRIEAEQLLDAAKSIAEEIDSYGYSAQEKAAYARACKKLREGLNVRAPRGVNSAALGAAHIVPDWSRFDP